MECPESLAEVRVQVQWIDKPANRMPEALWCSFQPCVRSPQCWRVRKLGQWVSPLDVIANGNRNLHGLDAGIRYRGPEGILDIDSLDAALVAPGRPRLLEYDHSQPDLSGGMHFNLFNNIWGTNFPLGYSENARFRFTIRPTGGKECVQEGEDHDK